MATIKRNVVPIRISLTHPVYDTFKEDAGELGLSLSAYVSFLVMNRRKEKDAMKVYFQHQDQISREFLQKEENDKFSGKED